MTAEHDTVLTLAVPIVTGDAFPEDILASILPSVRAGRLVVTAALRAE